MRIIEIVATRCQILRLKCTKFDFGWGSTPDPNRGLQRSPDPLAAFKGPTSTEMGGEGKGREGRKGWEVPPALQIPPRCRGARISSSVSQK